MWLTSKLIALIGISFLAAFVIFPVFIIYSPKCLIEYHGSYTAAPFHSRPLPFLFLTSPRSHSSESHIKRPSPSILPRDRKNGSSRLMGVFSPPTVESVRARRWTVFMNGYKQLLHYETYTVYINLKRQFVTETKRFNRGEYAFCSSPVWLGVTSKHVA